MLVSRKMKLRRASSRVPIDKSGTLAISFTVITSHLDIDSDNFVVVLKKISIVFED